MVSDKEEESSRESQSSLSPAVIEHLQKLMEVAYEKWEKRLDIRLGKQKADVGPIHVSDEERPKEQSTVKKPPVDVQAKEYYSSAGHSSHGSRRRYHRTREEPDRMVENLGGYKLRIPPFHGRSNPDEYMDWEKKCEFNFNLHNIINENRVKLAVSEFNDYALRWWEQITTARAYGGAYEITTWEEMKRVMRQRFVPGHYQIELHSKLRRLSQGTKSVDEYYQEMEIMKLRAHVEESQEATMSRFLGGLNQEIHDIVEMQNCGSLEEMLHKSILAEQQLKRKVTSRHNSDSRRPSYSRDSKPVFTPKPEPKGSSFSQDKSKDSATSTTRAREVKCYKCQGYGHYAYDCRNKRIMIIRENGEVESEDEDTDSKPEHKSAQEEYEAAPVMGNLLVARRLLSTQIRTEEEGQRENLFHSRCLVKGKVCSMIIDGGSCTNVASEAMVEKLDLETQKHPEPYQLEWINETGNLSVKEQVKVPLSIGNYEDEVLCDVLPMDAGHIILGRPWQSDRRVLHNGFANKYTFEHKGCKITLIPMTPQEVYKDQVQLAGKRTHSQSDKGSTKPTKLIKPVNYLIKFKQVKSSMFSSRSSLLSSFKDFFILNTNIAPVIPSEVYKFLQSFQVKIPKDRPQNLPPDSCLRHHNELVPGATQAKPTTLVLRPVPNPNSTQSPKEHCKKFKLARVEDNLLMMVPGFEVKRSGLENEKELCFTRTVSDPSFSVSKSYGIELFCRTFDVFCVVSVKPFERQVESSKARKNPMIVEQMGYGQLNKGRYDLDPDPSRKWEFKFRLQILGPFGFTEKNNTKANHNYPQGKFSCDPEFDFTNSTPFLAGNTDLRTNLFQEGGDDMIMGGDAWNLNQGAVEEHVAEEQLEPEQLGRILSGVNSQDDEVKHSAMVCLTVQHPD
uniref:CCHC-type domain-containing protein n=1 Tax=Noccaea caerulescens TaxID=107243 RepID=A0A1J3GBC8_NOCCA